MADSDSELEDDEEEVLVYVEFDDCETNDVFSNDNLKLDMLGLDSDYPVMQVNGKFFEGSYEDAVGTYLFFAKDDNPSVDDPVFDKAPSIKYLNKTRKLLRMRRAFVVPRNEVVGDSQHPQCIPNLEIIKKAGVPLKYQDEALSFWENSRNKRMHALQKYLKKQEFRKELRQRGFEPDSASDEDNPFAMYKYIDNELEQKQIKNDEYDTQIEKLKNSLEMTELDKEKPANSKKLTVIDPGPSTSKSSVPWIDDDEQSSTINKVKSIGRIREKTIKGKVQKKPIKKKKLTLSEKNPSENSLDQSSDIENENNPIPQEKNDLPKNNISSNNFHHQPKQIKKIASDTEKKQKEEEMEVDEEVEESERLLSKELGLEDSFISEKEKRKLELREAKKRAIKEKLKALSQNINESNS